MLVVDSTVWVDYFNGVRNSHTDYLHDVLDSVPIVVGDLMAKGTTWLLTVALTSVLAVAVWAQQTSPLAEEEALRQLVTVQNKMILLPDLLREVSKQTGVSLSCGRELSNDKLTVFVKGKPAVELLGHVATIVMGEWRRTKDGYMLVQTAQARKWEEELVALEREGQLRETKRKIERFLALAEQDFSSLVQRARARQKEMIEGIVAKPGPSQAKSEPVGATESLAAASEGAEPMDYLIGRALRAFSSEQWQRFWAGELYIASTLRLPGALPLPADALRWVIQRKTLGLPPEQVERGEAEIPEEQIPENLIVIAGIDANAGLTAAMVEILPETALLRRHEYSPPRFRLDEPEVTRHPLVAYWQAWQTKPEEMAQLPVLSTVLQSTSKPPQADYATPSVPAVPPALVLTEAWRKEQTTSAALTAPKQFALADILEWLAGRTEIQIIADAYRTPWTMPDGALDTRETNLGEWLKQTLAYERGWWRAEGDYLLVKHRHYWYLRRTELPEKLLTTLEAKAAKRQPLTLDDYASIAASVTPLHETRPHFYGYTVRFDITPALANLATLRFWASLSPPQKSVALRQGGLAYDALSPQQQRAFWNAAFTLLLRGWFGGAVKRARPGLVPRFEVRQMQVREYNLTAGSATYTFDSYEQLQQFLRDARRRGQLPSSYRVEGHQISMTSPAFVLLRDLVCFGNITVKQPISVPKEEDK